MQKSNKEIMKKSYLVHVRESSWPAMENHDDFRSLLAKSCILKKAKDHQMKTVLPVKDVEDLVGNSFCCFCQ